MFERFTPDARRVVGYAQEESRLLRHDHIGTGHVLLGLLQDDCPPSRVLAEFGVDLDGARDRIGQSQGRGKREPRGHIPFTPRAKRVLAQSLDHSNRLGQHHIAGYHLLLALLDVCDGVGARTLVECGVDLDGLAARADQLASLSEPEPQSGDGPIAMVTRATASTPRPGRLPHHLHYQPGPEPDDDPATRLDRVVAQRDAAANALRRYGRHDEGCDPDRGCSCGLQAVLDDLEPPDNG